MIEQMVLGALQGIVEWLPFSSEAVLVLVQVHWLGESNVQALIRTALFFHLGTFLAAVVYFRTEVWRLVRAFFSWSKNDQATQEELRFYVVATLISGGLGYLLLALLESLTFDFEVAGRLITIAVGLLLLVTAALQLLRTMTKQRPRQSLTTKDAVVTGLGQALAALPGVSRSGTTVSLLLLLGVAKKNALQLSFIMSLPIVLGGNILLNSEKGIVTPESMVGLLSAFVFGLITIHALMRVAERVKFGWFVFAFGIMTLIAGLFVM